MKKMLLLLVIVLNLKASYAIEEAVVLSPTEVYAIQSPQPISEVLDSINENCNISENNDFLDLDEDIATNKIEKGFYNFVNNRMVNNKFNVFSTALGKDL